MRISDWSSDVCSSDLGHAPAIAAAQARRRMTLHPDHPPLPPARIGVLLINLGTPDAPEPAAVRRYLAEFLSDRRVIEIPPIVWQPILRGRSEEHTSELQSLMRI